MATISPIPKQRSLDHLLGTCAFVDLISREDLAQHFCVFLSPVDLGRLLAVSRSVKAIFNAILIKNFTIPLQKCLSAFEIKIDENQSSLLPKVHHVFQQLKQIGYDNQSTVIIFPLKTPFQYQVQNQENFLPSSLLNSDLCIPHVLSVTVQSMDQLIARAKFIEAQNQLKIFMRLSRIHGVSIPRSLSKLKGVNDKIQYLVKHPRDLVRWVKENERLKCADLLRLDGLDLTNVSKELIDSFDVLTEVDLSHNCLTYLPEGLFHDSSNRITSINMSHNNLKELKADVFTTFSNLEWLDLNSNSITDLPVHLLYGSTKIRFADFSNNPIRSECLQNFYQLFLKNTETMYLLDNTLTFADHAHAQFMNIASYSPLSSNLEF